jgi:L-fuconolactonase
MTMRIDAHQHFWNVARGDYGWLDQAPVPIRRDFGPAELGPILDACDIERTVLVQAAPTFAETRHLLAIARRWPRVAGVVGWVDFTADDVLQTIDSLRQWPLLVGLRPMLQDLPDDAWILRDDVARGLARMADLGLVFDALVKPRHLPHLLQLARRHTRLCIVIDHAAKPEIAQATQAAGATGDVTATSAWQAWAPQLLAFERCPNVHCKLSGLITEAGRQWNPAMLQPFMAHALNVFGPDRLLWGSDWPVLNTAGGYADWLRISQDFLAPLGPDQYRAVMGDNAVAVYGLSPS